MTEPRIIDKKPYLDWTMFDSKTKKMKVGPARNHKHAIKKALKLGVVPRKAGDVRPMQGAYQADLMTEEEFQKFMQKMEK